MWHCIRSMFRVVQNLFEMQNKEFVDSATILQLDTLADMHVRTSLIFFGKMLTATATPSSLMPMNSTSSHCCGPSLGKRGERKEEEVNSKLIAKN